MSLRSLLRRHRPDPVAERIEREIRAALPRVYGYVLRRVGGDRKLAEDLTQDTMLVLATRATETETDIAWLFAVARHKVIDYYRAHGALQAIPIDAEVIADTAADIDRIVERAELDAGLCQIPVPQRIALQLHYGDGLSVIEISALLGKSEHAVESLLARGRRSMRTELGKDK